MLTPNRASVAAYIGRVFLGGQQDGAAAPVRKVDAPELDPLPSGLAKWPFLMPMKPSLPAGAVEEERDVGQRARAAAVVHHEGLEEAVVPLGEGARRGEQEEGDWFGGHGRIARLYQFEGCPCHPPRVWLLPRFGLYIVWVWSNRRPPSA